MRGIPAMFFNGSQNAIVGSGSESHSYQDYKEKVDSELAKKSHLKIEASMSVANNKVAINGLVTNTGQEPISNVRVMLVVYEDRAKSERHHVVRDMLPSQSIPSLAPGATQSFSVVSDELLADNMSKVKAIVFIQSVDLPQREILQAVLAAQES